MPDPPRTISLPTDLTVARVQESFASPDTLSVWELPGFIALLDRSGLFVDPPSAAFPVAARVAAAGGDDGAGRGRVFDAAGAARRRGAMIGSGVAAGFALFMISKIAEEFGQSRRAAGDRSRPGCRRRPA